MHKKPNKTQYTNFLKHKLSVVALVIMVVIIGNVHIARADPHAVFYTAIGQQQLFFNVLAALDQADYVETAIKREERRQTREDVETEPAFVRETESGGLLTQATELSQGGDTEKCVCNTTGGVAPDDQCSQSNFWNWPSEPYTQSNTCSQGQTRLKPGEAAGEPALVNRPVNLEGADLYTDQLVRELGAESARRNSMSELLRTLCDFGLGIKNCGFSLTGDLPRTIEERTVYRENAVVTEPLEWSLLPVWNGVEAALYSGELSDVYDNPDPLNRNPVNGQVKPVLNEYEYRVGRWLYPDIFGAIPFAYSSEMEWIWIWIDFLASTGLFEDQIEAEEWDWRVRTIADSIVDKYLGYPSQVKEYPLEHISFTGDYACVKRDRNGRRYLDRSSSSICARLPSTMTLESYIAWVAKAQSNFYDFIENIADNAASRVATQLAMMEKDGVIAPAILKSSKLGFVAPGSQALFTNDRIPTLGELTAYLKSPVAARRAAVEAIPQSLAALDASQQASALAGLDNPGQQQLVYRPGSDDSSSPTPTPSPGQQTSASAAGAAVAGLVAQATDPSPSPSATPNLLLGPITYDLFNPQKFPEYDKNKKATSPSANLIAPHLEQGAVHALIQYTGGLFRKAGFRFCGLTCLQP